MSHSEHLVRAQCLFAKAGSRAHLLFHLSASPDSQQARKHSLVGRDGSVGSWEERGGEGGVMSYLCLSVCLKLPLHPPFDSFGQIRAVTVKEIICPFLTLIVSVSQEKSKIKEAESL